MHTYREARAAGLSRRELRRAVATGSLVHVRRDRYVAPDEDALVREAIAHGVAVSCVTALAFRGVWTLPRGAHLRGRMNGRRCSLRCERMQVTGGLQRSGIDDVATALALAVRCLEFEEAVVALDSVLDLGLLTTAETEQATSGSAAGRRAFFAADGAAQSGLESLVRVRLRARRIRVRTQVPIRGVGIVDLVVGDRLVIETDGDRWHSTPAQREADRRRDAELTARGYLVIRLGYRRVVDEWPAAEAQILAIVRSGRHRWSRRANTRKEFPES